MEYSTIHKLHKYIWIYFRHILALDYTYIEIVQSSLCANEDKLNVCAWVSVCSKRSDSASRHEQPSVVNQPGCNPFTGLRKEKEASWGGGMSSSELTPSCKWMFSPPFMGSSTLSVCVRKREIAEREVFMSRYKILGRLRWPKVN